MLLLPKIKKVHLHLHNFKVLFVYIQRTKNVFISWSVFDRVYMFGFFAS